MDSPVLCWHNILYGALALAVVALLVGTYYSKVAEAFGSVLMLVCLVCVVKLRKG